MPVLEIRNTQPTPPTSTVVPTGGLRYDDTNDSVLPALYGTCAVAPSQPVDLVVRVHNRAGIPIIEGTCWIATGQTTFCCDTLRAVGIDAYAHVSADERAQIARRIWSRRVYATVEARSR